MKKIVIIALLIPYFLAVMSILIVLFPGLTLTHLSTDVLPNITSFVTCVAWLHSSLHEP